MRTEERLREDIKLVGKEFGHLRRVMWFDSEGNGPGFTCLLVHANVHPNENYPENRISIAQHGGKGKVGPGGLALTVGEAIELVKYLKTAIKEVVIACPTLALGTGERLENLDG